jgi:hypothetical protein
MSKIIRRSPGFNGESWRMRVIFFAGFVSRESGGPEYEQYSVSAVRAPKGDKYRWLKDSCRVFDRLALALPLDFRDRRSGKCHKLALSGLRSGDALSAVAVE